jgi:hypothetical protein
MGADFAKLSSTRAGCDVTLGCSFAELSQNDDRMPPRELFVACHGGEEIWVTQRCAQVASATHALSGRVRRATHLRPQYARFSATGAPPPKSNRNRFAVEVRAVARTFSIA